MFVRLFSYAGTMAGIMVLLYIVLNIVCAAMGYDLQNAELMQILVISVIYGFSGSLISLFLSKTRIKSQMHLVPITVPQNQTEKWLLETVQGLAEKKGVKTPEVCIYQSNDMNAFATGWNKDSALVAVSTALLNNMQQDSVEAVLGHEMSHVQNGDMVTLTLIQGVVNSFVFVFVMLISSFLTNGKDDRRGNTNPVVAMFVQQVLMGTLGFVGALVVKAFSRYREFRADAGSADVFGKDAMIHALQELKNNSTLKVAHSKANANLNMLCISDVEMSGIFGDFNMTHPSLDKRIAALSARKS